MKRILIIAAAFLWSLPAFAAQRVWISEFSVVGNAQNGPVQIATLPSVADQPVLDTTSGVKSSAAFNARTQYIRVCVETQSAISGVTTATIASMPMFAGQCEYFSVQPAATISIIANP